MIPIILDFSEVLTCFLLGFQVAKDLPDKAYPDGEQFWNAILYAARPRNEAWLVVINRVIRNVKQKYYGDSCLEPTGPVALSFAWQEVNFKPSAPIQLADIDCLGSCVDATTQRSYDSRLARMDDPTKTVAVIDHSMHDFPGRVDYGITWDIKDAYSELDNSSEFDKRRIRLALDLDAWSLWQRRQVYALDQ